MKIMLRMLVLPIISSFLLWCSFPPLNLWPLAWIALVPLFVALDGAGSARAAFGRAYLTGLLFFLASLQWIHHVTTPGLILLCAYLALYFGTFGVFYRWTARCPQGVRPWLIPAGWVVLEGVRGWAFTGFNWGSLGHTQADFPVLDLIASVVGVGGISFVLAGVNIAAANIIQARRNGRTIWPALRYVGGLVLVVAAWGLLTPFVLVGKVPLTRIALIQPNIPLAEAWSSFSREDIVRRELEMSRTVLVDKPDLIIWPETSFPQFTWELPELFDEVKAFARENRVSLLIGTVTRDRSSSRRSPQTEEGSPAQSGYKLNHAGGPSPRPHAKAGETGAQDDGEGEVQYFNSALLISPDGEVVETHSKRHLVLFGEFIPFRKEFPFLGALAPIDDFTPGARDTIFELPNGAKFAVLICFEDTIPELSRRYVQEGADFLVNMTNDAWFGDSGQQRMHLNNARFRAIENGRALVRATNTGESCALGRTGRVQACVEKDGRRVLVDGVTTVSITPLYDRTFYTKYGDIFTFLCLVGILVMVAVRWCGQRRQRKTI